MDQLQTRSQFGQPGVPSLLTTASSWKYDVFLSYRGADTRLSFTSNLFAALKQAGINTLKDDESLLVGEEIPFGLAQAIRGSRVSVVVLSSNFAGSTWCLEELAEIMKWRQTTGQLVLPVFYGVNPSDVRKQRDSFSQAFTRHEEVFSSENEKNEKIARWREALTEVGHLSGWVVGNSTYRDEATVIWDIVRKIGTVMNEQTCLHVASFPVGLDSYQQDINLLLSPGSGGVRFVGIVGMGGIGKTTLAKAIYNQFSCHFEGKSFLANVRMNSEQLNDAVRLQEQLLLDILMFKQMQVRVSNIHQGKSIIKERLRGKRVLIVLDDVSDLDQVRALAGDREWFGSGSRIILTTRYQHILEAVKVDSSYKVKSLDDSQSLQLFCSHAFGQSCPREEFSELSKQILGYSKGVPLALEILGSSLRDKTEEEWNDALKKLNMIPDYRIQAQLKISFDELGNDDRVKELFLDIACFFVGLDKDYVITILEACGLFAKKGMRDLIDKCLVEVDGKNRLQMHDLLRDMGREIVREKSPNNPGKRSRLWLHKDILSTIQSELGSKKVEGIAWNISESKMVTMSAEGFAPMKRLRLLKLKNVQIEGNYKLMSKELRWLSWHNYLSEYMPIDFFMGNLVALDMQHSNLREVWKKEQFLGSLKILNLSHSHSLTRTPDFSQLPNLEELILEDCISLADIHHSTGDLERLVVANFKDCRKLKKIPDSFCGLGSLRFFNISGCQQIRELPEEFGNLRSLVTFHADGTAIAKLPSSFGSLNNLADVSLCGCKAISPISGDPLIGSHNGFMFDRYLSSLKTLKLMDCNLLDAAVAAITSLRHLEYLDLRKNHFCLLPHDFVRLSHLKKLQLDDCCNLKELPKMPPGLLYLSAVNCVSLSTVTFSKLGSETQVVFTNCRQLRMMGGLGQPEPEGSIHLEGCKNLTAEFRDFLLKEWCGSGRSNVFLPGSEVPEWFDYQSKDSSSLSFKLPVSGGPKLSGGFTGCVIYAAAENNRELQLPSPKLRIEPLNVSFSAMMRSSSFAGVSEVGHEDDHMWVFHVPESFIDGQLEGVNEVKVTAEFGSGWEVKGLGVHLRKGFVHPVISELQDSFTVDPPQPHLAEADKKLLRLLHRKIRGYTLPSV